MKKNKEFEQGLVDNTNVDNILDKMLRLQQGNKSSYFLRKVVYIIVGICTVMFVGLICVCIYKNSLTTESILATLLAFFSIFISIFFYFKADETSTKFYDSSYKFMKDISVTLGKIEERFGEKLNSLNDKVSHLDNISKDATAEIEDKKEDKDSIINELMDKAHLSEEERDKYRSEIQSNELEIEQLRRNKFMVEREAEMLRRKINEVYDERPDVTLRISENILKELLINGNVPDNIPVKLYSLLRDLGYVDSLGNVNKEQIKKALNKKNRI